MSVNYGEHKMRNRKNRKKQARKYLWMTVLFLSLLGIIMIGVWVFREQEQKKRAAERYAQLQAQIRAEQEAMAAKEAAAEKAPEKEEPPVDFTMLHEQNEDIYAWICVPGTNIDYPVLQSARSDDYYLNHTVEHAAGRPGAIYTERANAKDFSDPNTVIYGHNMHSNGTMFFELHRFGEKEFFEEHDLFYIYTPEEILEYRIFAAYEYDDRHLLNSFDFSDDRVFEGYLKEVLSNDDPEAQIRKGVTVTAEDRIITLSTCVKGRKDHRWLVQAVRKDGD